MKVYAFIPARGGSKRVPGKNVRLVGGRSLLARAIDAAAPCGTCVVSTDDESIADVALACDTGDVGEMCVTVHSRPPQLASDHAQIEAAIAHWWTRLDDKPDAIVLLQPTSPFRTAAHVREALRLLGVTGADSVVGVTVGHEPHFAGRLKPREGDALMQGAPVTWFDWHPFKPMGLDRPRTQDLPPWATENGSIYVTRRAAFDATGMRASGHTVALPMTRVEGWDVDTEEDIAICNALVAGGVVE